MAAGRVRALLRSRGAAAVAWAVVALIGAFALIRMLGLERGFPLVPLMAFTPHAIGAAIVAVVVAALARRWVATVAAVAMLAALVLPRAFSHAGEPPPGAVPLRVLTSNILVGQANLDELASLVRRERIDVLSVQELTPEADRKLRRLIGDRLPHHAARAEPRTAGTGLYSRYPLRQRSALAGGRTSFKMARATMVVPSVGPVELAAVHPPPPTIGPAIVNWRHDLEALPRADPDGRPTILLGDFNATIDQAELREVLDSGYVDAAYEAGKGLATTWPANRRFPPEVTIDHVLADERIAVVDVEIHELEGSDHRPVSAELALPRY